MEIKLISNLKKVDVGKKIRIRGILKYEVKSGDCGQYLAGSITDSTGSVFFAAYNGDKWQKKILSIENESHVVIECVLRTITGGKNKKNKEIESVSSVSMVSPDIVEIDEAAIKAKLMKTYNGIQDKKLKTFVANCMNRDKNGKILAAQAKEKPFFTSPYASDVFNFKGGLAYYIARVSSVVDKLLDEVNTPYRLNKKPVAIKLDILKAAVLTHAIGTIRYCEIKSNGIICDSDEGLLRGRGNITNEIVQEEMIRVGLSTQEKGEILHIIETCEHGRDKWKKDLGAKTIEAMILHSAIEFVLVAEMNNTLSNEKAKSMIAHDSKGYPWLTSSLIYD